MPPKIGRDTQRWWLTCPIHPSLGKPFPSLMMPTMSGLHHFSPDPGPQCPDRPAISLSPARLLTTAQCMSVTHAPPLGPRAARPQSARSGSSWRTCPLGSPPFLIELGTLLSAHSSIPLLKPGLSLRMPSSSLLTPNPGSASFLQGLAWHHQPSVVSSSYTSPIPHL